MYLKHLIAGFVLFVFGMTSALAAGNTDIITDDKQTQPKAEDAPQMDDKAATATDGNMMVIELKSGQVVIELLPDVAPKHVAQIKSLVTAGEYDNVAFHRVIEGFMAQTGDVEFGDMENGFNLPRAGTGGSSLGNIPAEFSEVPFERGTVGMARSQSPNSANSQFFIMFAEGSFLNGQYTVFGQVKSGMEHVDQITRGDQNRNGAVANPDRMIKVTLQ